MEPIMNRHITLGLAMLASALFGAVAVNGLNAQSKPPGAYAVGDIAEMMDANLFRDTPPCRSRIRSAAKKAAALPRHSAARKCSNSHTSNHE
jgi:hypothetical protein